MARPAKYHLWRLAFGETVAMRKARLMEAGMWHGKEGFVAIRDKIAKRDDISLKEAECLPEFYRRFAPPGVQLPANDAPLDAHPNAPFMSKRQKKETEKQRHRPKTFADGTVRADSATPATALVRTEKAVAELEEQIAAATDVGLGDVVRWLGDHLDVDPKHIQDCKPPCPLAVTWHRIASVNEDAKAKFVYDTLVKFIPPASDLRKREKEADVRDPAESAVERLQATNRAIAVAVVPSGAQGSGGEPGVA